jgi:hypothetical protein
VALPQQFVFFWTGKTHGVVKTAGQAAGGGLDDLRSPFYTWRE